jgi:hypothetical protein
MKARHGGHDLVKGGCCLEDRVFEVEYIGKREIQRSLKRVSSQKTLCGKYWLRVTDSWPETGCGEMEGRGTGESRENTR